MSGKGKSPVEELKAEDANAISDVNGKPSSTHIEDASQGTKVPRTPYWDTEYVVGATRNLPQDGIVTPQEKEAARPKFLVRRWRHYKRHWKLYTVIMLVLLAILLPIFFLVVFPAIAQRIVDDSNLPIYSASIMNPTPDSVEYSLSSSLKIPAGVTVNLKPITLSLFTNTSGPTAPYIKVDLPEYNLKGNTSISIVNQTATILDQTQFRSFLTDAVKSKKFTLSAAGSTVAYLGKLKAAIKLNKNIDLSGLNRLDGFAFQSAAVVFPPDSDGTNLKGTVILPNPTVVTFELGNVTLNMIIGNIYVGLGRLDNVLLRPGNNTVSIRATFDIATALKNLGAIIAAEGQALRKGNIVISASGNSTVYNGAHIPYYEEVLNSLVITGEIPLVQVLVDTLSYTLGSNNSFIQNLLGSMNGTDGLTGLLEGLIGNSSTKAARSLPTVLSDLML